MTLTPQPLPRSTAEEIDLEMSRLFPDSRHDWSEDHLRIATQIIQRRIEPLVKLVEESKAVANALDETALDYFVSGYWKISNQVEEQSKRLKEALSKL